MKDLLSCDDLPLDSIHKSVQYQHSELHLNCKIVITVIYFRNGLLTVGTLNVGGPTYPHSDRIDQDTLGKLGIAFVHGLAAFFPHGVLLAPSLTLEGPL